MNSIAIVAATKIDRVKEMKADGWWTVQLKITTPPTMAIMKG